MPEFFQPPCGKLAEEAAIAEIPRIQQQVFDTEDFKEGIQSFAERRQAEFTGR